MSRLSTPKTLTQELSKNKGSKTTTRHKVCDGESSRLWGRCRVGLDKSYLSFLFFSFLFFLLFVFFTMVFLFLLHYLLTFTSANATIFTIFRVLFATQGRTVHSYSTQFHDSIHFYRPYSNRALNFTKATQVPFATHLDWGQSAFKWGGDEQTA